MAVTVDEAFGPEVPDEQNLFAHPALEALRKAGGMTPTGDYRRSWASGGFAYRIDSGSIPFGRLRGLAFQWRFASAPGTVHLHWSPTEEQQLAQIVSEWPELDGLADALRRPFAVRQPGTQARHRVFQDQLDQAIRTLGSRGTFSARLGNSTAAADDANALLEGARTLLHAKLPLNDKILMRSTVTSTARIIRQGCSVGAWNAKQLDGFEKRLVAIDPHTAMISGLRCSLSLAVAEGANAMPRHESVVSAWRSYQTPDATWPDRAEAVWYYHRTRGLWYGDVARRCETVDGWLQGRRRFTAEDWKLLRPQLDEFDSGCGMRPDKALPLAHVALAAAHALDLETELALVRLAVGLDQDRILNGRYMVADERLLIDPWSGGKLKVIHSRIPGEEVEIRSVGPDGVASSNESPWGNFTEEGDRSRRCGYHRTQRPLPKFPVAPDDPNR